mgnify:CR=1 FL=1|tara:strand:+ start:116 stop:862 length:747 start_codon:yes stop_codon:yes gene_type:complete
MNYSVLTTSDKSYFPHLKILINSILDKCDLKKLKNIYIIDNGLDDEQKNYFLNKTDKIIVHTTGLKTNFKGGTWGEDWQINVKSKTVHLHNMISHLEEPLLLLDADMLILKDLNSLLEKGGDIQVCLRDGHPPGTPHPIPYIGSYFFSINHKKALPFVWDWMNLTQSKTGKGAHESPSLTQCVKHYLKTDNINIVSLEQELVDRYYPPPTENTIIVHFKGSRLFDNFDEQFSAKITNSDWYEYVEKYL